MKETMYDRIKRLREEAGLSQDSLAKSVGYSSRGMISKIEKGKVDISGRMISEFARALNTTPRYLMDGDEEETHGAGRKLDLQLLGEKEGDDIRLLIRGLHKLTPEQVAQAKAVFKAMFAATNPDLFDDEGDDNGTEL